MEENLINEWEEEIELEQAIDAVNEGKENNIDSVNKKITTMYCHMIKYKYCNEWQDSRWVITISNIGVKNMNDILKRATTNTKKLINLPELFAKGISDAVDEAGDYKNTIDTASIPDHPIDNTRYGQLDWFKMEDLANKAKIDDWLDNNKR